MSRLLALALVPLLALPCACASVRAVAVEAQRLRCSLNPSPVDRRAARGLDSTCVAGTIVWMVPVEGGVVLIDAGFDETGAQIKEALQGRTVKAILLTHGHLDHRAAAHQLGAPVYIGRDDVALLEGTRGCQAPFAQLADVVGVPPRPKTVLPVDDGDVLVIGGRTFTAVGLPGHTPGSTGWLTGRVMFTGDAVQGPLGDGELYPAPATVTDDMRGAYRSLRKLKDLELDAIFDGHFGLSRDVRVGVQRAALRDHDEATLLVHPGVRPAGCREGDLVPFPSHQTPVIEAVVVSAVAPAAATSRGPARRGAVRHSPSAPR